MKLIKYLTKITTPKGVDKGRNGTGVALHISDLKETNMEGRKIELLCTHSKQWRQPPQDVSLGKLLQGNTMEGGWQWLQNQINSLLQ